MTRGQAYEPVVRIARQAGIDSEVTPHTRKGRLRRREAAGSNGEDDG